MESHSGAYNGLGLVEIMLPKIRYNENIFNDNPAVDPLKVGEALRIACGNTCLIELHDKLAGFPGWYISPFFIMKSL